MGGFETGVLGGPEEGSFGLVSVFGLRGPSREGSRVQWRGRGISDFAAETKAGVGSGLLAGFTKEAKEEKRCLRACGIWRRIQVKSESRLEIGNERDRESSEVARRPSEVPALVQEEPYPGPGGDVDSGGRPSKDMLSELGSSLVELVCRLRSQNVCVHNGVEDERVRALGLATAEVGGQHVRVFLLKENEFCTRLGP
jgi:hypothetical protein